MGLSTLSESMLEVVKQFKLSREEPGL
jgi:hypothetical protein